MRVVIVSDFGTVNGGAAKVAIESARALAEAGHQVVFACAIAPVSERLSHPGIEIALLGADEVWRMGSRFAAARQGIWNDAAGQWLAALLARQPRGTVVHLHQWTKAFSPSAIAAAGASGLPVFLTLHDYFAFCPAGGYYDFQQARPCDRKPMGTACVIANCDRASYAHKLVRVARQWRSDRALAACRDLTCVHVSDVVRRFATPFLPAHARHVTVPNMVDRDDGPPADVASNRGVAYVGRLTEEKGVLVLAEAARRAGVPVRFVGDGPMRARILALNPDADVTGWLEERAAIAAMRDARAVVAPSLWYETGPLTVMQAAACGIGAIASEGIGAAADIVPGETGLLVPAGDVDALAVALKRAGGEEAVRWGGSARSRFDAMPRDLAAHGRAIVRVYAGALAAAE